MDLPSEILSEIILYAFWHFNPVSHCSPVSHCNPVNQETNQNIQNIENYKNMRQFRNNIMRGYNESMPNRNFIAVYKEKEPIILRNILRKIVLEKFAANAALDDKTITTIATPTNMPTHTTKIIRDSYLYIDIDINKYEKMLKLIEEFNTTRHPIFQAIIKQDQNLVKLLLSIPEFHDSFIVKYKSRIFVYAAKTNNIPLAKYLISLSQPLKEKYDVTFNLYYQFGTIMLEATQNEYDDFVKFLFELPREFNVKFKYYIDFMDKFLARSTPDNIKYVLGLPDWHEVTLCYYNNKIIRNLFAESHFKKFDPTETFNYLLSLPPEYGINPADSNNKAAVDCIACGDLCGLKLLLNLPKHYGIDLTSQNDLIMNDACNAKTINFLIEIADQYNLDFAARNNIAFINATRFGQLKKMRILLNLIPKYNINPADQDNSAFIYACRDNKIKIVKFLLNLPKEYGIDPSAQNNKAIITCAANGHEKILKLLLSLPKEYGIDITARNNAAFIKSCKYGNLKVVRYLIHHADKLNIDPGAQNNKAIKRAVYYDSSNVIQVLTFLSKLPPKYNIDFKSNLQELYRIAHQNGSNRVREFLRQFE
jgi:hypothetical protein